MGKRDSDGFFSRKLAYRTNDRSYNSTDLSLVTVDYQQSFLAIFVVAKIADQARTWLRFILHNTVQLHMHILVVTVDVYSSF